MAGCSSASSFPFNPIPTPKTAKTTSPPYTLFSLESKLCALHLRVSNFSKPDSFISLPCAFRSSLVTASYGGSRSYGNSWRSRQSDSDEELALDLSSIRASTVRLIDEKQNMVGVVPKSDAIQMAEDAELDLVILFPDAAPQIMDYNKYRYELQKKKRVQQRKSAASRMDLKELKMGYNIDQHNYDVRLRAARKFLKDGNKVKVIVNLKGRENDFRNIAIELISCFQNDIGELATEESKNFRDRNIFITLVPNKVVLQKTQEPPRKKNKSAINEVSAGI